MNWNDFERSRNVFQNTVSLSLSTHDTLRGLGEQGTARKTLGRARFNPTGPRGQSLANGSEKLGSKDSLCVNCIKSHTQGQRIKEETTREDLN